MRPPPQRFVILSVLIYCGPYHIAQGLACEPPQVNEILNRLVSYVKVCLFHARESVSERNPRLPKKALALTHPLSQKKNLITTDDAPSLLCPDKDHQRRYPRSSQNQGPSTPAHSQTTACGIPRLQRGFPVQEATESASSPKRISSSSKFFREIDPSPASNLSFAALNEHTRSMSD